MRMISDELGRMPSGLKDIHPELATHRTRVAFIRERAQKES